MSQCIVPNWNLKHQRQEEQEVEEEAKIEERQRSNSHVLNSHLVRVSNYDQVAELTWENGQLAMHGLNGLLPTKPPCSWVRSNDTLESIVHQFTSQTQNPKQDCWPIPAPNRSSNNVAVASSGGNWPPPASLLKKRGRSDVDYIRKNLTVGGSGTIHEEKGDRSACGSGSAAFCRDNDTTMITWGSLDSPHSMKTAKTMDEDQSACHDGSENPVENRETRDETAGRSFSTRRSPTATIHNLSERRRRDRINQKMKTLQKLVPNSSKTDKASMLDEVIEYLKQLQAQVQLMSMRSIPQIMMPLGMQQQQQQQQLHQMSILARMGMAGVGLGMGMGMLDINSMARNASQHLPPLMHPSPLAAHTPSFLPPPFVAPPPVVPTRMVAPTSLDASSNGSLPLHDPYSAFLAQSMNMDLYSKMAALYRPQINQTTQTASNPSKSNMQEN